MMKLSENNNNTNRKLATFDAIWNAADSLDIDLRKLTHALLKWVGVDGFKDMERFLSIYDLWGYISEEQKIHFPEIFNDDGTQRDE